MYTYKQYKKNFNILLVEEAEEIYEKMVAEIDFNDSDVKELWDVLIKDVLEYAAIRSKWSTFTKEEHMDREKDLVRTGKHNIVISSFNVLSRYLEKIGKDIKWREQLGEERKRIGDFACYIAFIFGLNAR
jgi:RNAse (barnase) inhibitor barstar